MTANLCHLSPKVIFQNEWRKKMGAQDGDGGGSMTVG